MIFKNPYWTTTTKIELLQRWIIVHSILYYDYDTNLVPDRVYDMNLVQLAEMMKSHPKSARQSKYAYAFSGFKGSTGYDIPSKLTVKDKRHLYGIADFIVKTEKEKER